MQNNTIALHNLIPNLLRWLGGDEKRFESFMGATGLSPDDLVQCATAPEFHAALLDHIMTDEASLIQFCDNFNYPYHSIAACRAQLPGGDAPHWT